ncbi:translin family protein [Candidatus Nitrosocosmicus franklandus]|uniref:Translin family protein n=1 Tax=Candidatus Nitrosocosmicus franklandianus TaxID=1798806 RepID=A0A484IHH6_9ARCH|nr:RNA-binding protein [Candidatus Nitrosocosmicus franklandus]VFJ15105.1 Translin family protein [Candidatus Nitrosocosmicus franklandus]
MSFEINFSKMNSSLDEFSIHLKQVESSREKLIKENREVILFCSKAIISLHSNKIKDANDMLVKAFELLKDLRKFVISDLDRYLWPAEQEYVEAYILKEIVEKKNSISSHLDLDVSLSAYLIGLLDCIGEIKRMIYDSLRRNDFETSLSLFVTMQTFYDSIYPFSIYDNILPGIRKKLDVGKRIIEDVRVTVTEEQRRKDFLSKFQK